MTNNDISFIKLTVYGLVQGVGFRPYTACLCEELKLRGFVKNSGGIVEIAAGGKTGAVSELISRLSDIEDLPGARVTDIKSETIDEEAFNEICGQRDGFHIRESDKSGSLSIIPADIGICKRCEEELTDSKNRRYLHPFISCVSCGPRFSVMKALPYDRENTSMEVFPLCGECKGEYDSSPFRRYAQTLACNGCGPVLKAFIKKDGEIFCAAEGSDALDLAVEAIREGKICAVKNVGGYHFVFDAFNDEPAIRLREYKTRENKPFAVMFPDADIAGRYCILNDTEKNLLCSGMRPIVLLMKNGDENAGSLKEVRKISPVVNKNSTRLGAMLPCDAIQVLLSKEFPVLVMTSANRNSEPIERDDDRALGFLADGACDLVLANDRKILQSLDDSIFQVIRTEERDIVQIIRRARGLVPKSIETGRHFEETVFAYGGDLKAVFGFGIKNSVVLSGHYGDLDNAEAFDLWKEDRAHYEEVLGIKPGHILCDMHPGYNSVKEAERSSLKADMVQHHYAHIMSVAAEHKLKGRILGLALDGTGFGTDGKIWGSELLVCDCDDPGSFVRAGHFEEIKLTGGENSVKNADIAAMCFAFEGMRRGYITEAENPYRSDERYALIEKALENDINTYHSTSAGRLFDALSAALDICHENSYEGECPVLLMQEAENCLNDKEEASQGEGLEGLQCAIKREEGVYLIETVRFFCDILKLKEAGCPVQKLAYAFHEGLSDVLIRQLLAVGNESGLKRVALSGGVFTNPVLLKMMYDGLLNKGFEVYVNEQVPPTDGGIALGQLYSLK